MPTGRLNNFSTIWNLLLIASCDAAQGTSQYHALFTQGTYEWPVHRLIWIAQDDYQRRDPSPDAPAFYDYLQWFFPDDPWVTKAVADFHQRGGADEPIDISMLSVDLQNSLRDGTNRKELRTLDWNHVLTPWRVATCVHQLLERNQIKEAARIAAMYRDVESIGSYNGRHDVACELVHKVALWNNPTN
jgi:hypothetical protein